MFFDTFNSFFSMFFLIFVVMFIFITFNVFRQFGRVKQIQDRVFDTIDRQLEQRKSSDHPPQDRSPHDYHCNQCGAKLEDGSDVSPSGDFKCEYCGKWSNIHS